MTTETTNVAPDRLQQAGALGKRIVLLLAVIIVIGGVYWWTQAQRTSKAVPTGSLPIVTLAGPAGTPLEGNPAPNLLLTYADGQKVRLSDFKGRPVFINFWATWCGPCRAEMPEIVRLYQKHKDDGLVVLAINVQEAAEQVEPFVKAFNMSIFPVALDVSGQVTNAYRVRNMPSSFFVDRNGIIQVRWQGFLTPETMAGNLAKILD